MNRRAFLAGSVAAAVALKAEAPVTLTGPWIRPVENFERGLPLRPWATPFLPGCARAECIYVNHETGELRFRVTM